MTDPFRTVIDEPKSLSPTPKLPAEKTTSERSPPYNSVAPSTGPTERSRNDVIDDNLRWCSQCGQTRPTYTKSRFQLRHILMCFFIPGLGWAICMAQCCAGDMVYCTHCDQRYSDFYGKEGCCDCCPCSCCKTCCCWFIKKVFLINQIWLKSKILICKTLSQIGTPKS